VEQPSTSYDLNELSDQAGVTPRTVRYYIQQGLLRSPGSPGPGAKYDEGHLLRLRLIRRLQREHLPLSEIRRRLESMRHDDVRKALESPTVRSPVVEYVERVLSERKAEPRFGGARSFLSAQVPAPAAKMRAAAPMPPIGPHAGAERSQWDRVSLGPDLELHVRRPLSRAHNKIVEKLLDYVRRLLEEDTP
jgi:DNA-binding transcriptional MerR regulator